ncbi:MAG: PspC domain-containing protein [Bacillota bacterium]
MSRQKLYRSRTDNVIGGVCGGLARHLDIDSAIIRLLLVLAALMGGSGVIFYIIAWVIIPMEPEQVKAGYAQEKVLIQATDPVSSENVEGIESTEADDSNAGSSKASEVKQQEDDRKQSETQNTNSGKTLGIILIGVGLILFLNMWFPYVEWRKLWPAVLVLGGIYLLIKK